MLYFNMKFGSVGQVTALIVSLMLDCCRGQMRNITFTASAKSQQNCTGRSPGCTVDHGADVVLECDADCPAVQVQIFRDNKILNTSHGNVQYLLQNMACSQSGTYECRGDNGENKTFDVLINQCNPWPCPGYDVEMTVYVQVNQTVQISFCVLAYPWIMEHLFINGSRVRHSVQSPWKWDFVNETVGPIPKFNITVSRDQMVIEEYGILNISVYSSTGIKFSLNYNILLLTPGPPQCPNLVEVTCQGQSYITLSWEPGLNGGAIQSFHVYFTNNHVTWYRLDVKDGLTSVNITGLLPHVNYSFRVASSNVIRPAVSESACENTTFGKIQYLSGEDKWNIHYVTLPVCAIFIFLSVLLAFILCRQKVKALKQNRHEAENITEAELQDLEDPGYYISSEGLKYVTLNQVQATSKRHKPKRRKRKQEKVVYAVLDFSKTGKMPV